MAKIATLAAILGVLLVMSHAAAANRATITTVDIEEPENQKRRGGSCYEQIERQDLDRCEQLFEDVLRCGGGQYGERQFGGDQYGECQCSSQQLRQSRHFRPCCQQLRQLDDPCRCKGLREVVREQKGGFGGQGSQEDVTRCVRNLNNVCGFESRYCDIRAMW
ncbi:2S seed storage albumin protein-like [Syzygium oleosum]|uniref:2S seed storage albumin protein-like n=1 Tax=Syzygium oleosum TaxID=219896 RepID=UPI0011D26073|nr:2S seed storage albumin protein-like [Syzygium oleosum]